MRNRKSENGGCAAGAMMLLGAVLAAHGAFAAAVADGARAVNCPEGPITNVVRAAANIPGVKTAYVNTLNVLDILNYDKFIVTQEAVKLVEEVYD